MTETLHKSIPPKLPVHPPTPNGEPSSSSSAAPGSGPKPQKQMTKAERRELQERQRAAKAAAKAEGGAEKGKGGQKKEAASGSGGGNTRRDGGAGRAAATGGRTSVGGGEGRTRERSGTVVSIEDTPVTRGLKIFSHFALQRPQSHTVKGDVHPAVVRLGLMFANFGICGANARCIATLSAFKEVYHLHRSSGRID
jgi:translation initiation factor eIF-2B subunit delta